MPIFLKISYFRLVTIPIIRFHSKQSKSNLINILKGMPKEQKHIAEAQKQRKKIKERISKYVPGKVTLQVLGTGAKGAPRALYMFSDQSRYLFNCGEGTQRLAHEHKMKLAKLEHIFITQPVWKNIGGLPGTALTIQDVGVPEITLHGPPGLDEVFAATKRFVVIRDLKIHMADCSENNVFEDNVISVRYVPLTRTSNLVVDDNQSAKTSENGDDFKNAEVNATVVQSEASTSTRNEKKLRRRSASSSSTSEEIVEDNVDYYAHEHSGRRITPNLVSITSQQILQDTKEKGISMTYICRLQPRPGALNLDKCVRMGVPPGPLLGKLKGGEDVVLPNGNVVTSKDVCEPDDAGPVFIVVDCPSEEYLDSLTNSEELKRHQIFATEDCDIATLVVHFTPADVVQHPRYKKWMENFSASTQHMILNETNSCMGSQAVHRIQYKLNMLSEDFFPLLSEKGMEIVNDNPGIHLNKKQKCEEKDLTSPSSLQNDLKLENLSVKSRPASPTEPYIFPKTFCSFHLRPKLGLDRLAELKVNPAEYLKETMEVENFSSTLQELCNNLKRDRKNLDISQYPQILFLGTGSCIPNKTRNTSGILLKLNESQNMLLDCGEGTCGQIIRFFGHEEADRVLANISAIYISHLHADHHIGLIGLLQGRRRALDNLKMKKEQVYLFAPKQILAWLNFYDKCFENIRKEFHLVPNGDLIFNNQTLSESTKEIVLEKLGMSRISTCFVRHCPNAFGVAFTDKNGRKITYSGDTMPSDNLVELGTNSDVLIHEATMEDELAHEAVIKMHSTTSQAIDIGKRMNAKHILLTHFSQRYAKLPRFNDNFAENVGIAFDNMQVRIDELPLVPHLYPALRLMFAEHYEELEHKAVKRQLKIEKQREASINRNDKRKQNEVIR
ncbi:ribonuclease Z, mitochondrial [Anoplophora glabripennis]|nr:ribonuclease Z, mitochondrial [Anoplophora glabripennis]